MFLWSCLILFPMVLAEEVQSQLEPLFPFAMLYPNYTTQIRYDRAKILTGVELFGFPSTTVDLSRQRLEYIDDNAFSNVTHAKILNLSRNMLTLLEKDMFAGLINLESLDLTSNSLHQLTSPFTHLTNLEFLKLTECNLDKLVPKNFFGLIKSCVIVLDGNSVRVMGSKPKVGYAFTTTPELLFGPETTVKICIKNSKLISLEHYFDGEHLASNCRADRYYVGGILDMTELGIAQFEKDWYKLRAAPILEIYLGANRITRLTSEMFNDLPESISSVDLSNNKILRLEKGIIVNQHLREMNFEHNEIIEIEDDTFTNTNLTILKLSHNNLTNTQFAATLPPTLTEIHLDNNKITEINDMSFLKLKQLTYLYLSKNNITNIHKGSFRGLSRLQYLELMSNRVIIEKDSFRHLRSLRSMMLDVEDAGDLDLSEFGSLPNVQTIFIGSVFSWNYPRKPVRNKRKQLTVDQVHDSSQLFLPLRFAMNRPQEKLYLIHSRF